MKNFFILLIVFIIILFTEKLYSDTPWSPSIRVSSAGGDEPTIAVSYPNIYVSYIGNPQKFRMSTDGGLSWQPETSFPQGTCCDGSMYVDNTGYLHISTLYLSTKIAYYRSTDYGTSWTAPFLVSATFPTYSDKNWTFVNKNRIYITWIGYNSAVDWRILISKSTDKGLTFSAPVRVDIRDSTVNSYRQWPVVREDPKDSNIVYVSMIWDKRNSPSSPGNFPPPWQCFVAKSTNGGTNWLPNTALPDTGRTRRLIGNAPYSCTGSLAVSPVFNDVYVVWTDSLRAPNGKENVFFSRSTNGAISFEPRVKIPSGPNPDTSYHFKPWVECDRYGTIHVIWYDTRGFNANSSGGRKATYYTYSTNRGQSWAQEEKVSDTTDAFGNLLYGHYLNFTTDDLRIYASWCDLRLGLSNQNIYYSWRYLPVINSIQANNNIPKSFYMSQNYPNPFNPMTSITYELPEQSKVLIRVFDVLGRTVRTLVDGKQNAGKYEITWDAADNPSGTYFYRLTAGDYSMVKKMILVK